MRRHDGVAPDVLAALKAAGGRTKGTIEQSQFAGGAVNIGEAVRLLKLWSGLK